MMIPGEGEVKDELCGTVKGYQKCPECGYKTEMLHNCGRVQCPECYMHWVSKSAKRISQRVHGFAETLRNYPKSGDCIIVTKIFFTEGEFDKGSNVQNLHIANSDKAAEYYNLDIIIGKIRRPLGIEKENI